MKFIQYKLTHSLDSVIAETVDSAGSAVPVYEWTQAIKEDMMCKLRKSNIQSLNPFYQLMQDIWDLALELSQPASSLKGRSHKLKPLTSITSFCLLAIITYDEKHNFSVRD